MACATCGKIQAGRCEGGMIAYLAGEWACPKNPDRTLQPRLNPDFILPALIGDAPEWKGDPRFGDQFEAAHTLQDDEWTVQPEPTSDGLEDLL